MAPRILSVIFVLLDIIWRQIKVLAPPAVWLQDVLLLLLAPLKIILIAENAFLVFI